MNRRSFHPWHAWHPRPGLAPAAAAAALLCACRSPADFRSEADVEVYRIVEARRADLLGKPDPFQIDPPEDSLRQQVLRGERPSELDALTLVDCLEIGAENSREYQDRREELYLAALDLTLARYQFDWQHTSTPSAALLGTGFEADAADVNADARLSKVLGTGAEIVGDIGLTLFKDLSAGDAWQATSNLGLSITQPLLRGFGSEVVLEPLTQAERDVVYAVREYERFRRTFAFDVAERVFRILQQRDQVLNEEANHASLKLLRERNEALGEAGRLSDIEVDQARQDELQAESATIDARADLETQLDDLKEFLGLPIDVLVAIDPRELERLPPPAEAAGEVAPERVVEIAQRERLDYRTVADRTDDAGRAVRIAIDELRAGLDVALEGDALSEPGQPLDYDGERILWTLRLDLDLPIDRLVERNAYRAALIALDASRRAHEALGDSIAADVRDEVRDLASRAEQYQIQSNSVLLAERRVENSRLNLEAGRANTRDLLEAQEALVNAQNDATRARIDYELARLSLYRDLEALRVDESGVHVEPALEQELRSEQP